MDFLGQALGEGMICMQKIKTSITIFFLALYVIMTGPVWSQDAVSQMRNLSDEIKKAGEQIRYQGEQTVYAFSANKTFVSRFHVQYDYPFRKKVCIDGPKKNHFILLEDGKHQWSYFPARKMVVKEPLRKDHSLFPTYLTEDLDLLEKNYRFSIRGPVPAGNVQCRIIEFQPKWEDRPRREIWLEERCKVPVRVYISSQDGRPTYTAELQKVVLNPKFESDTFKLRVPKDTKIYEVSQRANLSMEDAQKILKRPLVLPKVIPPGYMPYNIVLRKEGIRKRLQIIYSDGLSSFSVFQEGAAPKAATVAPAPAKAKSASLPAAIPRTRQYGLINVVTFYHSGQKTVFVGDIKEDRLLDIARSLSKGKPLPLPPKHRPIKTDDH